MWREWSRGSLHDVMFERALRHSRSARPVNISRFYVATKFLVALQDAYAYEDFVGGPGGQHSFLHNELLKVAALGTKRREGKYSRRII